MFLNASLLLSIKYVINSVWGRVYSRLTLVRKVSLAVRDEQSGLGWRVVYGSKWATKCSSSESSVTSQWASDRISSTCTTVTMR